MRRDPGRLRIGFSAASPIGTEVHPEAVAAVAEAAQLLRRLGHEVEEAAPAIDGAALANAYLHMYFGVVPAATAQARAAGARDRDFELLTRVLETLGRATPAGRLTSQLGRLNEFARALAGFHRQFDLFLTPTLAHPPVRHGTGDLPPARRRALALLDRTGLLGALARGGLLDGVIGQIARDNLTYVPFTQLANLTGTPAMSVPLHWTADGLPLGVQFVAPFGREDRLLHLAHQLETAQPWFQCLPAGCSATLRHAAELEDLNATLVAWHVVTPPKGGPFEFSLATAWLGLALNGLWGLGTELFLRWLRVSAGRR